MNDSKKRYSEYFLLSVLLIAPKVDLISFQNIYQGIRLEDLVVLYLAYILIYFKKVEIRKQDTGYNFILYFFIYLTSCMIVSVYLPQQWIILIRYIEYIVIIIYFNRNLVDIDTIFKILKVYLILNLIMVVLQQSSLIGEFSSLGYESPLNKSDDRPTGLTGGPWELANCSAIIFFCILLDKKQSQFSKILFSLIALFLIYITHSRTVMVSISVVIAFYFFQKNLHRKQLFPTLVLLLVGTLIAYYTIIQNLNPIYTQVPKILMDAIVNNEVVSVSNLDGRLWSMAFRMKYWLEFYRVYETNLITNIFGIGAYGLYMESTLLRVFFGGGLVGTIFVLYSIRKIPLYMLLYLFISGLTLDLMMSFKIFCTVFIYFYLIKNVSYENRN